ncbi:MAG: arabinan endo-1,5-alpha-L-arabinosidase [Bacteroides sp.]|nr:arabinan endo-1,5-alpha-L-arabinosidase [Bacteroides sp.]
MKKRLLKAVLLTGILFIGIACRQQLPFTPYPSPNPWADNYHPISGMKHYKEWGTYNVHDPACLKVGDYFYTYSTDAIFRENRKEAQEAGVPLGYIQVRRSRDLVNWDFCGWAFPEIPGEAATWVKEQNAGKGTTNIWAPYVIPYKDRYRLYYCVSAFGRKTSYIGLAEAPSPEGPWELKGCAVKSDTTSVMNAIDPSVIVDPETGKWWMHYGSYFGGLFCVELNPETGLPVTEGDQGHLVARHANYRQDNLEAPEIIHNPELGNYFLFVSYDPLMTTYNVRAARSDKPEGPFTDFFGKELKDTTNNFPILTAPYRFENHPGWAGTAHCGVVRDDDGRCFMLHQGRLSPHNQQMILHVRELFFTPSGWPVVSPQRYTGTRPEAFRKIDLAGEWEIIRVREPLHERQLEAGQVLWGEGELQETEQNLSRIFTLSSKGTIPDNGKWRFSEKKQLLELNIEKEILTDLLVFAGHDWENETETILFTGLDKKGRSVWGKRIK